jgi:uncharacterized membrane protein YraQ (UPF0718 family)
MYYLYILTALALGVSFVADRRKTFNAIRIALSRLLGILPAFLLMLIFVSIVFFLVPDKVISDYLASNNRFISLLFALFFGSITIMPGFIAFPLAGILLSKGVPYMVLSGFTTTLMIVGFLTFPIEKQYYGVKVAVIRNLIGFFIAVVVALVTGLFFGELF